MKAPNPKESERLVEVYLRVRPEDIAYVKFVLESYESVGFMRTIDPAEAVVVLLFVPDFAADGERMLESISREIDVERVPRPAELGDDWLVTAFLG